MKKKASDFAGEVLDIRVALDKATTAAEIIYDSLSPETYTELGIPESWAKRNQNMADIILDYLEQANRCVCGIEEVTDKEETA